MNIDFKLDEKNTVWDEYCPIVHEGIYYNVYMTEQIDAPTTYNKLIHILNNAKAYEHITLHINNGGGYVDSGFMLIDAIKNCEAHVVAKLSGTVASIATVITLACDEVQCAPYLSFMIHNYSTSMSGKGHEVKAYQNFSDAELNRAFKEIYKGFLTDDEMQSVIDGTDMWMNEDEVMTRLDKRDESSN